MAVRYIQQTAGEAHVVDERLGPNHYRRACDGHDVRPIFSSLDLPSGVRLCADCEAAVHPPAPGDRVVALMDALNESVEKAKATRRGRA